MIKTEIVRSITEGSYKYLSYIEAHAKRLQMLTYKKPVDNIGVLLTSQSGTHLITHHTFVWVILRGSHHLHYGDEIAGHTKNLRPKIKSANKSN